MKHKAVFLFFSVFSSIIIGNLIVISCTHDSELANELEPICFTTQVLPIIQTSCALSSCHSGSGGEFSLENYSSVMNYVTPGDARASELYRVISTTRRGVMMPPDRPLTKDQRTIIMVWINQGAKNSDCENDTSTNPVDPDSVCFVQKIQPLLASSCALSNCHDQVTAQDGYIFTDYNSIMNGKKSVEPYNPNNSKLYEVLFETGEDRMPPAPHPEFSADQKELIRIWIADGALNSDCLSQDCDTLGTISFSTTVFPILNYACVGCHNASIQNGNVNLSDYTHVAPVAQKLVNGTSLLLGVIRADAGFIKMPPTGNLSNCEIKQIEMWVAQGVKDN